MFTRLHWSHEPGLHRAWWGETGLIEISTERVGFAAAICQHDEGRLLLHLHMLWPNLFITLPTMPWREIPTGEAGLYWGFSLFQDNGHFNWGDKCKIIHWPWSWQRYSWQLLMKDGSWRERKDLETKRGAPWRRAEAHPDVWRETYSYHYRLGSSVLQVRKATISCQRTELRWRWLMWLPFPRRRNKSIDVEFSDEVGERSGSWKGGCTGCGYTMLPHETPREALRRMEQNRKF